MTVTVNVLCHYRQQLYRKAGVIQLTTVSAGGSTDRNVLLSVDVDQLNVTLFFQKWHLYVPYFHPRYKCFGDLLTARRQRHSCFVDRISSYSKLFSHLLRTTVLSSEYFSPVRYLSQSYVSCRHTGWISKN